MRVSTGGIAAGALATHHALWLVLPPDPCFELLFVRDELVCVCDEQLSELLAGPCTRGSIGSTRPAPAPEQFVLTLDDYLTLRTDQSEGTAHRSFSIVWKVAKGVSQTSMLSTS